MFRDTRLPDDVRPEIQTVTLPGHQPTIEANQPLSPMCRFWKPYRFGSSPIRLRPITPD